MNAWAYAAADRYYTLAKRITRKYDPKRPIVGDRYCQYYDIPIVEASRGKIDVCSTNYGAEWPNGEIARFFLKTLHTITDKPVLIGEFYECAKENRTGSRNTGGLFPTVRTQAERAAACGNYVRSVASRPYVIGAHWFQYYDEPPLGRADGEDYNMGLVDVQGRPYDEITRVAAGLDIAKLRAQAKEPTRRRSFTIPPAPKDAASSLADWPHARSFVDPAKPDAFADLYVSANSKNLYVGLIAMDYMDESLYEGGHVPQADRPLLRLSFGSGSPQIELRFGGKAQKPTCTLSKNIDIPHASAARSRRMVLAPAQQPKHLDHSANALPKISIHEKPGIKYTVILTIPRTALDPGPYRLKAYLASHARAEHMNWSSLIRISNNLK